MTYKCVSGENTYTWFSRGRRVFYQREGVFLEEERKGNHMWPLCSPAFQALMFSSEQPVRNFPGYQGILIIKYIYGLTLIPSPMDFHIMCDSNL